MLGANYALLSLLRASRISSKSSSASGSGSAALVSGTTAAAELSGLAKTAGVKEVADEAELELELDGYQSKMFAIIFLKRS